MTKQDAYTVAQQQAAQSGHPMELWEHVGGQSGTRKILPQGRWVVLDPTRDSEPKHVWAKRATIEPNG